MTYGNAYESAYALYADAIERILERRTLIRKTYLCELGEQKRAKAEKIFGNYGSGSEDERSQLEMEFDKKYKAFLQNFFENNTFEVELLMSCFSSAHVAYPWKALESVEPENKELLEAFSKKVFLVEDIPFLDDRAVQKVLREVHPEYAAKALVNASTAVREKVSSNMSKRVWRILEEKIKKYSDLTEKEYLEAEYMISSIILRLVRNGEIFISDSENNELIF